MSEQTIKEYQSRFRNAIVTMANILNKIFNPVVTSSTDIPSNFVNLDNNKIQYPLVDELTYRMDDNTLKKRLFERICKNLSVIYTKPFNTNVLFNPIQDKKKNIPLSRLSNENGIGYIGVQANNLKQYSVKDDGTIASTDIKNVQDVGVCQSEDKNLISLQEYFYLKLKLMVYLRSVLNLYPDETYNQYETILRRTQDKQKAQPSTRTNLIGTAEQKFGEWYSRIIEIFKDLINDNINDKGKLIRYIEAFEKQDGQTKNLCEAIIKVCDVNITVPSDTISNTCNNINIHSVTEDICKNVPKMEPTKLLQTPPEKQKPQETIPSITKPTQQQLPPSTQKANISSQKIQPLEPEKKIQPVVAQKIESPIEQNLPPKVPSGERLKEKLVPLPVVAPVIGAPVIQSRLPIIQPPPPEPRFVKSPNAPCLNPDILGNQLSELQNLIENKSIPDQDKAQIKIIREQLIQTVRARLKF
jgi:hypothetical protein